MPLGMLAWRDGVLREQRLEESESDVQRVGWCAVVAVDVGHPGASRDDDVGREAGNETRGGEELDGVLELARTTRGRGRRASCSCSRCVYFAFVREGRALEVRKTSEWAGERHARRLREEEIRQREARAFGGLAEAEAGRGRRPSVLTEGDTDDYVQCMINSPLLPVDPALSRREERQERERGKCYLSI